VWRIGAAVWASGVWGLDAEGEGESTTHILLGGVVSQGLEGVGMGTNRWALVATSLATVCARVE
jgi:hypothetical protein